MDSDKERFGELLGELLDLYVESADNQAGSPLALRLISLPIVNRR
jgi:hypothetical protein